MVKPTKPILAGTPAPKPREEFIPRPYIKDGDVKERIVHERFLKAQQLIGEMPRVARAANMHRVPRFTVVSEAKPKLETTRKMYRKRVTVPLPPERTVVDTGWPLTGKVQVSKWSNDRPGQSSVPELGMWKGYFLTSDGRLCFAQSKDFDWNGGKFPADRELVLQPRVTPIREFVHPQPEAYAGLAYGEMQAADFVTGISTGPNLIPHDSKIGSLTGNPEGYNGPNKFHAHTDETGAQVPIFGPDEKAMFEVSMLESQVLNFVASNGLEDTI